MTFSEKLNNYIEQLGCSSRDLSNVSSLSSTVISRYRNGDRTPAIKSTQFEQLIDGVYKLSCDKKIKIDRKELYSIFSHLLNDIDINFDDLSKNVNAIISTTFLYDRTGFSILFKRMF